MLSDKLISDKIQYPRSDDSYEPRPQPQRCTPLDQTFACGFVLVMTIVGVTLYFALNFPAY